jgi:UDP-glucose:(heptosyl)LPS alpha-1,3-glucosyltransferase
LIRQRYAADGGAERFVARLLGALQGRDLRATLITRRWTEASGFDVAVVNSFYIGRLWRDWSFARAVRRLLATRRFDLVQSHERIPGCDIYRAGDGVHREWLAQRARTLSWWRRWLQGLNPYHRYVLRAERQLFTSSQLRAVICNSEMVRAEIKRYFGVADEKLHVIYNGIDLTSYSPVVAQHRAEIRAHYGIPDDATLFLFVGSGFERKGMAALLAALRTVEGDPYLLVVGRDKKLGKYKHRARMHGLAERVIFAGHQPDVKPYYGAADALVLPTLYDPFPNVALEALACGLPVITSTKSGAAELIESIRAGYVCDALDAAALAAALRQLMQPARRKALSDAARRGVASCGLNPMGERLATLYRGLLRPR